MSVPLLRQLTDADHVCKAASEEFVELAKQAMAVRGRFIVALSGGSTPKRLYNLLSDTPWRNLVDWSKVEFFWGDERGVPPDHADSNFRMAMEALLHRVPVDERRIHRMEADRPDREQAAREYQETIARVFGVSPDGPLPVFDLVFLGMGPDGHTASLFPETTALDETRRWVVPNYVPRLDSWRMTLTVPVLNQAANVIFLVAGADKADRLAQVLEGPRDPKHLPAQLIQPVQGRLVWLLDQQAAANLTSGVR